MHRFAAGTLVLLFLLLVPAIADTTQDYSIAYMISLHKDGSALWSIEYRIPLRTSADEVAFEQNANTSSILSEASIRQLMEQSAAEASSATGRPMALENFVRVSSAQSMPTGTYGVIRYTFLWTNFTQRDDTITMGDVFVGGLYLPVGASLIVQVPTGYAVTSAEPVPETVNGNLVWYGPASFDAGQPSVTLAPNGLPLFSLLLIGIFGMAVAGAVALILVLRKRQKDTLLDADNTLPEPLPPPSAAANTELRDVEERILNLITEAGGEMYQSDIVERLSLPKSSVSAAINSLHTRKLVQKVKKGRENLIRRMPEE
jgi:uncharacterized membrane protein